METAELTFQPIPFRFVCVFLIQFVEGGEFALVEGFEALGFVGEIYELLGETLLLFHRWNRYRPRSKLY